ncbi:MAG: hypothetical protein ACK4RG_01105 [Fimbriimonadales bacterium]
MQFTPEELQVIERMVEALRRFPHLRRAMIEVLQIEDLFAVPERLDDLTHIVAQIAERVERIERIALEAKRAAERSEQAALEAKQEAQEAKQEAREAKQVALEAKQEAQEAKQEAREAKQAALEAKQEAQEAKQEAREAKEIALDVRRRLDRVEHRLKRVEKDVAALKGDNEETKARRRLPAVLGRYFKKMRIYDSEQLYPLIGETLILEEDDAVELLYADLFVHALTKASGREYWMVVEVSWGVGVRDVERAYQRAQILQKHGYTAIGVAMGRTLTPKARQRAQELGVLIALDGRLQGTELLS